jgi:hypothetical protein
MSERSSEDIGIWEGWCCRCGKEKTREDPPFSKRERVIFT